MNDFLGLSAKLDVLPVLHGSGDFAVHVRNHLLRNQYDCLAVPLPPTWIDDVLAAVELLPTITAVVQCEPDDAACSYVPVDPCQPVIAALRYALQERLAIEFVDLETQVYEPHQLSLPDPYALKKAPVEKYLASVLAALPRPAAGSQQDARVRRTAFELHRLELEYDRILFLPSLLDWPWLRQAYQGRFEYPEHESYFSPINTYSVHEDTLTFFLGELPYVTALYERARSTLDDDENLSIDGVKELVLEARDRWRRKRGSDRDWLSPKLMQIYFQYVRNLTLLHRRLTPDLYTLIIAAKQIGGDGFALALLETAKDYSVIGPPAGLGEMKMGVGRADLPEMGATTAKNRLPGQDVSWRTCKLVPEPPPKESAKWKMNWNPYQQCSWPAEDDRIESFHAHVREQAKALLGADLARSEKFTTSVKDGLDIRETLRHWHTGDLYVKDIPPSRGGVDVVLFLFDVPADPKRYPWRTTWHAEHNEESTIGLFATDFREDMVGPGIGRATYGGVFFLYPPRYLPEVWTDPRLPQTSSLEERLLAACCFHGEEKHVVVVSPCPLRSNWRRLAGHYGKRLVHIPLTRFSGRLIDRLRTVHVLGSKEIRSYAAKFIRDE